MSGMQNSQVINLSDTEDNEPGEVEVKDLVNKAVATGDKKYILKLSKVLSRSQELLSEGSRAVDDDAKNGKRGKTVARSASSASSGSTEPIKKTRGRPKKDTTVAVESKKQKVDAVFTKTDDAEMREVDLTDEVKGDGPEQPMIIKIKNGIFLEHKKWTNGRWYVGIRKVGTSGFDQWINFTDSFDKLWKAVKIMRATLHGNETSSDSE